MIILGMACGVLSAFALKELFQWRTELADKKYQELLDLERKRHDDWVRNNQKPSGGIEFSGSLLQKSKKDIDMIFERLPGKNSD